jgi:hypothetical protein
MFNPAMAILKALVTTLHFRRLKNEVFSVQLCFLYEQILLFETLGLIYEQKSFIQVILHTKCHPLRAYLVFIHSLVPGKEQNLSSKIIFYYL